MKNKNEIVIYVSVLNWNKAEATLFCLESLFDIDKSNLMVKLFVVDNGSDENDWSQLSNGLKNKLVTLIRLDQNLGFSGGHNIVMKRAIDDNVDYVWLVNNDGVASPDTLTEMVNIAENDYTCGAVSPVIVVMGDESVVGFCGAYHDWENLNTVVFKNINIASEQEPYVDEKSSWLSGAAVLFKVKALKEVGLLDDSFFAYYEDNDICAKLAFSGWKNRIAYCVRFAHEYPTERKLYYDYLMVRNEIFFWLRHTPQKYRRFIRLRLLERAIFKVNKLLLIKKEPEKAAVCLLGIWDGFLGRGGEPNLNRNVPWIMTIITKSRATAHWKHIDRK